MLPLFKHPKQANSGRFFQSRAVKSIKLLEFGLGFIIVIGALFLAVSASWSYHHSAQTYHPIPASSSFPVNNDVISTFLEVEVPSIESPFMQNWPGYRLPHWAQKKIYYNIPSREQQICFTHVGKTAGSTVGCSLGFSLHCNDDDDDGEDTQRRRLSSSLLAKLTTHTFHKDVYDCDDDSGYFLFVVRDPVARVLSAFNYERPDWSDREDRRFKFYYDCPFELLEDFVQNGLREQEGRATRRRCKKWAFDAIRGEDKTYLSPAHWYYNYQYYYEAIPADSKILVIRNEHIEEDIRGVEDLFGSHEDERLVMSKSANTNTWSDRDDLYLSDESISVLCQALCNEIQVYKKILHQALNMSEDQLQVSLRELEAKCPHEAIAVDCVDSMPDIQDKIRENRGY